MCEKIIVGDVALEVPAQIPCDVVAFGSVYYLNDLSVHSGEFRDMIRNVFMKFDCANVAKLL